jgi:hypothetical protein
MHSHPYRHARCAPICVSLPSYDMNYSQFCCILTRITSRGCCKKCVSFVPDGRQAPGYSDGATSRLTGKCMHEGVPPRPIQRTPAATPITCLTRRRAGAKGGSGRGARKMLQWHFLHQGAVAPCNQSLTVELGTDLQLPAYLECEENVLNTNSQFLAEFASMFAFLVCFCTCL